MQILYANDKMSRQYLNDDGEVISVEYRCKKCEAYFSPDRIIWARENGHLGVGEPAQGFYTWCIDHLPG